MMVGGAWNRPCRRPNISARREFDAHSKGFRIERPLHLSVSIGRITPALLPRGPTIALLRLRPRAGGCATASAMKPSPRPPSIIEFVRKLYGFLGTSDLM